MKIVQTLIISILIISGALGAPVDTKKLSHAKMKELIDELEIGINNGGFNGYFYNSAGNNTHEALNLLKAIEAKKAAAILESAASKFPDSKVPKNRDSRQDILDEIDPDGELFSALDEQFWKLEENLQDLLKKYINSN
ncbi:MAG: DUF4375 domain-containing protein [Verrucomicrobiota bacterium]